MKKKLKTLFKAFTAIITIGGILYVARDQIKDIINKVKEVTSNDETDEDFDDEPFDDDIFPEPSDDDRDYVSINFTNEEEEDTTAESETVHTDTEETKEESL